MINPEQLLGEKVVQKSSLGGGCIGSSQKITTQSGRSLFIKTYQTPHIAREEARGLTELSKCRGLHIPEVVARDDRMIIMEYIETASPKRHFFEDFGKGLAQLHRISDTHHGFEHDNFIGTTPQINLPRRSSWCDFFIENRLDYQVERAAHAGHLVTQEYREYKRLREKIPELLAGTEEPPALLHGDLWGGNYMCDRHNRPVIFDPAVYYGHREADLAMTSLFGRLPAEFYSAYSAEYPLKEGYARREPLYQLYHILNHLNLFGRSYKRSALSIIRSYL
ncbi:MAG: fructosamine kinase family protein [Fibrobacterota bacterium]